LLCICSYSPECLEDQALKKIVQTGATSKTQLKGEEQMAAFPFFIGKAHCWDMADKFASAASGNSNLHIPFPATKPKSQGY